MNPNRQRRIVFYVGDYVQFRRYVSDELSRLRNPRTGVLVVPGSMRNGGRVWGIERGREFRYLGTGRGDCHRGMRGLSASAVVVVYGIGHRASDDTREWIAEYARIIVQSASPDERQREADLDEAMRESGEPYEILVEFFEAHDAMDDERGEWR